MRRRLRAQKRVREALLLDLGATVWELHRQGRREAELLQAKAAQLAVVDEEVRGLAEALEVGHGIDALSDAHVVDICAGCAALLTPGSRYCPACGNAVGPADEALTEIVETPLPAAPGNAPQPAGGPSLRRRMGRRLRGTPPR